MKPARKRESESAGVVDAGVLLARLDRRRASHADVVKLFERAAAGRVALHISVVNLAEVFQHAGPYIRATGLDLLSLLAASRIAVHRPDADVAQRVADLSASSALSLADRFAAATAAMLKARLHTTDAVLATILRKHRLPVTMY
jgi:predicted nucleic acid-binding protein